MGKTWVSPTTLFPFYQVMVLTFSISDAIYRVIFCNVFTILCQSEVISKVKKI